MRTPPVGRRGFVRSLMDHLQRYCLTRVPHPRTLHSPWRRPEMTTGAYCLERLCAVLQSCCDGDLGVLVLPACESRAVPDAMTSQILCQQLLPCAVHALQSSGRAQAGGPKRRCKILRSLVETGLRSLSTAWCVCVYVSNMPCVQFGG
jgi:hypothetical protein